MSNRTALSLSLLSVLTAASAAAESLLPNALAAIPPGETTVLKAHAVGQQIYECKAGSDGKLAWTFREPMATLMVDGKVVGHHSAGPTWQLDDGSAVVGKPTDNAPGARADDIPWLRLEVVSHKGDGGRLAEVNTVQRINTLGGVLAAACDRPGATRGMPYAADYVFLRKG